MKKLFAILVAVCMLASALCVTAFAASDVLTISAIVKGKADPVLIGSYTNFEDGWNAAMKLAGDEDEMKTKGYERIVVDLHTDWKANKDGQFSDDWVGGAGFDNDTIYVPADARVTLNLNGHTINRGLTEEEDDGEVIFINDDADVIINNGTITGGYSNSEGGGLYIEGGANVTLNNVNIVGNAVCGDDGAGIYLYGGATLIMNGGSVSDNHMDAKYVIPAGDIYPYGAVCVYDSTAIFNEVTFEGNYTDTHAIGLVLFAVNSTVKMNKCTVSDNATKGVITKEIIHADKSSLTITDTNFINNNTTDLEGSVVGVDSDMFYLRYSDLSMSGGTISKNVGEELFNFYNSMADIKGVTITDNTAGVMYVNNGNEVVNVAECTIGNNTPKGLDKAIEIKNEGTLTMVDCVLGDTTFSNPQHIKITSSEVSREEAVIGIDLLRADGTSITQKYYKDFAGGWNFALECPQTLAYDRVVVDLYADWNTKEYGVVTVPENIRITINMNGHTINRGLTEEEDNGEVMYVDEDADLIINGGKSDDTVTRGDDIGTTVQFGTITGGYSDNGAGGIHINGAHVELNNVKVKGNVAEYDDGAGIAAYDSTVIIRGGSLIDNTIVSVKPSIFCYGGGIYAEGCTVTMEKVEIKNNQTLDSWSIGMGIYVEESKVTVDQCIFDGNGVGDTDGENPYPGFSTIYANDSTVTFTKTTFINNGSNDGTSLGDSALFEFDTDSYLEMDECVIQNNAPVFLFDVGGTGRATCSFYVKNSTIIDNLSAVIGEEIYISGCFENCTFNNNEYPNKTIKDFSPVSNLVLRNCSMGDSTYDDYRLENSIEFQDADGTAIAVGSVFGEGSLTMIVSLLSLVASGVAIFLIADTRKKLVFATANKTAETEAGDEESLT